MAEQSTFALQALRFAQAQALTERARGRVDEERAWLDMCALLEKAVTPTPRHDSAHGGLSGEAGA